MSISAQTWNEIQTTGAIPARANASMIYDQENNRLIVFGGNSASGYISDIWALDLSTNTWTEIVETSDARPEARHTHDVIFDESNNRMIIFAGQGIGGLYNDVWSFNMDNKRWQQILATGSGGVPVTRYGTVTVHDLPENRLVTFGGFSSNGRLNDTWALDLASDSWTKLNPGTSPVRRCLHNGNYVPDRDEMIIYGGQSSGNREDIWSFDLKTDTWTDLTPNMKPPGRHFSTVTYLGNDRLLLFGGNSAGQNNFSGALNDLWEFSLSDNTWTELSPSGVLPAGRVGANAVFIPTENRLLVFGGNASNGDFLNDVWELQLITTSTDNVVISEEVITGVFPNPFKDNLQFELSLQKENQVQLSLHDTKGRLVSLLFDGKLGAGQHRISEDLGSIATGVYMLTVQVGGKTIQTKKVYKENF